MKEEERLSKYLYRFELYLIKTIPVIIAALGLLNTILSYYNVDVEILSFIGGISLLPWLFLYISSFVFKFCLYHRLFLYYIAITELLAWYDYKFGVPLSSRNYLYLHLVIAFITIVLVAELKINYERNDKEIDNEIT